MRVNDIPFQEKRNLLQEYGEILAGTRQRFGKAAIGKTSSEKTNNTLYLFKIVFKEIERILDEETAKREADRIVAEYCLQNTLDCGYVKIPTTKDYYTTTSVDVILHIVYQNLDVDKKEDVCEILQFLMENSQANKVRGRMKSELKKIEELSNSKIEKNNDKK